MSLVGKESLTYAFDEIEQVFAGRVADLVDIELGARSHDGSPHWSRERSR